MTTLKVHYAGGTYNGVACGTIAKNPSVTMNRDHVDCGNCLRWLAADDARPVYTTPALESQTTPEQMAEQAIVDAELLGVAIPAGNYLANLKFELRGTTVAPPELDENGRFIGDDSPFTVLETIELGNRRFKPVATRKERSKRGTRKYRRAGTKAYSNRHSADNIHHKGKPAHLFVARSQ